MLAIFQIDQASLLQPDHPDPLELGLDPGLIILFHTGIDTSTASYAPGKIETVSPKNPCLGRLCADLYFLAVLFQILLFQSPYYLFFFILRHFTEMLLEELFHAHLGAGKATH